MRLYKTSTRYRRHRNGSENMVSGKSTLATHVPHVRAMKWEKAIKSGSDGKILAEKCTSIKNRRP